MIFHVVSRILKEIGLFTFDTKGDSKTKRYAISTQDLTF